MTVITTIYTAVGGIKAVVWTDLIQAVLMFSSVTFAIFLLLHNIPGGFETVKQNQGGFGNVKVSSDRVERRSAVRSGAQGDAGGTLHALCRLHWLDHVDDGDTRHRPGHGATDVDRARLFASRNSSLMILSGVMDFPIAAAFLTVGILLSVFYYGGAEPGFTSRR